MSFIIAIIVLSILKLTFTIGRFIAAKRLNLPVEKFIVGIDWGKPIFAKKFADTELIIYPLFWGGFLSYKNDFDTDIKCSPQQKNILTFSSLFVMLATALIITLVGINFVPSGNWETFIKSAPETSIFKIGDKIVDANGTKINGKNTFNLILQKNRFNDGIVDKALVNAYKKQLLKLNRGKCKNGEFKANTEIKLPERINEGKITHRTVNTTIKLNNEQKILRKKITDGETIFNTPVQLHDLATALADTGYKVIITVERNGDIITLPPVTPDEFGVIEAQYQTKTIYLSRDEFLNQFRNKQQINSEKPKSTSEKLKDFAHNAWSIIAMLLLISILVLVHEAGHYLAAKMFKMKVERFGFGLPFGPILWQKQCGETLVVVHAFLLGGYVSFPDDDKDNALPKNSPERFANKPIYQRLVVVSAGVFANILCAIFIVILTALLWGKLPTENYQTIVEEIQSKDNISLLNSGLQAGDKITEINGSPVDTNYAFQLFAIKSKADDGRISDKNAQLNLANLQKMNPKFKANEILPQNTIIKLPTPIQEDMVELTDDMLRGLEKITDNKFALTAQQTTLRDQLKNKKTYQADGLTTLSDIAYAISDNACPIYITINRNDKTIKLPAIFSDNTGIVGVKLDKTKTFVETKSLKTAIIESYNYLYIQTSMLLKGLWQLFTGKVPLDNMHGVVAVVKYGGDVIQQDGLFQGLLLVALISLDLAIVNFLPIPALDGGHVIFLLLEKIYGKPLDEETVNGIATAGFMFLILLMVIVLYNDIVALALHKI